MDLEEVKVCLRALLSSTPTSYHLVTLLNDFKTTTGFHLPLFGYPNPMEFLKSLNDTVQLCGNSFNPEVALIESKKSAHIISLVDRQKSSDKNKTKNPYFTFKQKRQIVPIPQSNDSKDCNYFCSNSSPEQPKNGEVKPPLQLQVSSQTFPQNAANHSEIRAMPRLLEFNSYPAAAPQPKVQSVVSPFLVRNVTPQLKAQNSFSNQNTTAVSPRNQPQSVEPSIESTESQKTDDCFFEDLSDNDSTSCPSTGRSSSSDHALSTSDDTILQAEGQGIINEGVKIKLKKLIKNHPGGLWCCELPQLLFEQFNFVLDYREYGYTSLIQMLSELPDVFRCVRPGNEDWILFDASVAPTPEERKISDLLRRRDLMRKVRGNLQRLLSEGREDSPSVEMSKLPELYQKMFGESLDFQALGFKDVLSLLETWEGSILNIFSVGGKLFCNSTTTSKAAGSPARWEEALPPITAENDIFVEIFPKEVVGPEENLLELDLTRHIAIGQIVEVCIAEVWSPGKFFVQLNKFKNRLNRFMDELQKFYGVHLNKYKMPDSTIRPSQICVGLYNADPEFPDEWHRAQILKVVNEKTVLINFVDYGTVTRVKKSQLRFLHRSFQSFPIQAFQAQLSGVAPPGDESIWPMTTSKKFLELLRVPHLNAEMIDIDFKKPSLSVVLFDPFDKQKPNINEKLVLEKLAKVKEVVQEPIFFQEEISATKKKSENKKGEKKRSIESSRNAIAKTNEILTGPFLDVDELNHFETKSHSVDPCSLPDRRSKVPETKGRRIANASCVFEEIPELQKCNGFEGVSLQANKKNPSVDDKVKKQVSTRSVLPATEGERRKEEEKNEKEKTSPKALGSQWEAKSSPDPNAPHAAPSPPLCVRKPPGLEHMNPQSDMGRMPFLLHPENIKRKVNVLALELLASNASIRQVGASDPTLALKIATEMAEALVTSQLSLNLPLCLGLQMGLCPPLPETYLGGVSAVGVAGGGGDGGEEVEEDSGAGGGSRNEKGGQATVNVSSPEETPQSSPLKKKSMEEFVKKVEVGGKSIHVVKMDDELFVCVEEIIRQFTLFSNREVVDRILHIRKIATEYKIVSKNSDEKVLRALKSCDLPGVVKRKSKKLKIYLLQVYKVVPFLLALGCRTKPFEKDFMDLQKEWDELEVPDALAELS